jgi:hypothetical protein
MGVTHITLPANDYACDCIGGSQNFQIHNYEHLNLELYMEGMTTSRHGAQGKTLPFTRSCSVLWITLR